MMPARQTLTTALAAGRVAYAAGLLVAPRALGSPWVGPDAGRAATQVGMRGLAARDLATSIALLVATRRAGNSRGWLLACAAGDIGDATATVLAARDLPRAGVYKGVAVAAVTAAAGLALARDA